MGRSTVNFIPRPDAAFDAWVKQYAPAQQAWWAAQGLAPAALTDFTRAYAAWLSALPAHVRARAAAEAARATKDHARAGLEAALRPLVGVIQATPSTTDADRATLGITVRDTARTRVGMPAMAPRVMVDVAGRLTHTLRVIDESNPTRTALPRGVRRVELFVAMTPTNESPPAPPPVGEPGGGVYRYLGSFTKFPARLTFEAAHGGETAHYLARYASARGGVGGWSAPTSATVAA